MADPDRNPHLPEGKHWHVENGGTDWLPELSPHYKREAQVVIPPNYRRWRRILLWSIFMIWFMAGYIWLEDLIGIADAYGAEIRMQINCLAFQDIGMQDCPVD